MIEAERLLRWLEARPSVDGVTVVGWRLQLARLARPA